ncbi:MAG: inositol monophosphatase [Clostridia bacterium]|nr:inositol monophosphatase [Clostridia bacterium]
MYEKIEGLARKAGQVMLEAVGRINDICEKSSNSDIVTEYDVKIQEFLESELLKLYPDAGILGEEGDKSQRLSEINKETVFIIDPIDGTTNFVRNFYKSAVSIALVENGEVVYGCCYVPYSDEMFTAEKNKGAFCNGKKIMCYDRNIEHSVVLVGTAPYDKKEMADATFGIMRTLYNKAMDIRRFGSAVIDLLDVACGKADIFCELRLSPWDHAAAGLIAEEAGAVVSDMKGNKLKYDGRSSIIAATRKCYDFFFNCEEIQKYNQLF